MNTKKVNEFTAIIYSNMMATINDEDSEVLKIDAELLEEYGTEFFCALTTTAPLMMYKRLFDDSADGFDIHNIGVKMFHQYLSSK